MGAVAGLGHRTLALGLEDQIERAFPSDLDTAPDPDAKLDVLRRLHGHYLRSFAPPEDTLAFEDDGPSLDGSGDDGWVAAVEAAWNRWEEARAIAAHPDLPTTPGEFGDWYFAYAAQHEYRELCDHLRHRATLLDLGLFVLAEDKVDGRFDDVIALSQIGATGLTKMTIAHNFWDEMGNGEFSGVHTAMFEASASWARESVLAEHGIDPEILEFPEAYADACELLMYALRRRYLLRSLASIGLLEQTAPARFAATVAACRRLGLPDHVTRYQEVHVSVDEEHGKEWFDGVFVPIMEKNPAAVHELALGVVIRGNVASEFFNTVHQRLFGLG